MIQEERDYQEFFKEEIYDGFVKFLLGKLGSAKVIALIGDDPVFDKKGVHVQLRKLFNQFLNENPKIEKRFVLGHTKCYLQRNIVGEPLVFPVDVNDEELMVKQNLRLPLYVPVETDYARAGKHTKRTAEPMKNQVLKGDWKEEKFLAPSILIVHFKRGFAAKIGKTTESFKVLSKQEVSTILFDTYHDKVAFAQCNGYKFEFVKRSEKKRNVKQNSELQGSVQQ